MVAENNPGSISDNTSSQILLKLGEMSATLGIIDVKLAQLPDHEARIRSLERWKYSLPTTLLFAIASAALAIASWFH